MFIYFDTYIQYLRTFSGKSSLSSYKTTLKQQINDKKEIFWGGLIFLLLVQFLEDEYRPNVSVYFGKELSQSVDSIKTTFTHSQGRKCCI